MFVPFPSSDEGFDDLGFVFSWGFFLRERPEGAAEERVLLLQP